MVQAQGSQAPTAFLQRMSHLLGDEYGAFLASYDAPAVTGLRVNTLKTPVAAFQAMVNFAIFDKPSSMTPVPWCPTGFIVPDTHAPGKHPWHASGLYYLQEPSAMAVAELLDPRPGERVLDMAAAPGGKATHIAALMGGEGLLVANEVHPKRAWELAENLERWGVRTVAITHETPERLAGHFGDFFDRVLLDAPCSGEGMFRKSEAARREWSPALVHGCALRQSTILEQAARLVRPGGRLVYSTCTFAPEEDEAVVARFLEAHPEYEVTEPPRRPGFLPGRPDWIDHTDTPSSTTFRVSQTLKVCGTSATPDLARAVRLWPHTGPGEGHFIAVLQRKPTAGPLEPEPKPWPVLRLPRPVERAFRVFCEANLITVPASDRLALVGSYLYALPLDIPEPDDLRFIHPGWWLGTLRKDRFEPSHALALGLKPADALRSVSLPADSPNLRAYLSGSSFGDHGDDGWLLVAVDGFSLGWGKRVGGIVKSHYPKGLRWM